MRNSCSPLQRTPIPLCRIWKAGIPSEFARRRPDIAAAEARLHSATASTGVAVADLYPRTTLGASFGSQSVGTAKLGAWGARDWSVGPSISLPCV